MKMELGLGRTGALALAALLAGTAPAALLAETPPDTLVIADAIDDIVSLDPHEAFEFSGVDVVNNVYDGLLELDPENNGTIIPGLAESWSVAEDGLTYSFKIRAGATFSSGNPVRAEDAAWSLQRVVKLNKNPAFILTQFGFTPENAEEKITFDGDTVTFVTDRQYAPSFVYNCLTAGVGAILDKETVMANAVGEDMGGAWLNENSAGSGYYVLKSYKPKESFLLEAREGGWRGAPKMKRIFMRHIPEGATQRLLLEKGDIDMAREMTPVDIAGVEGNADIVVQNDVGGQLYYLSMNQKNEVFRNPKVLDAMRYAVDYKGMEGSFLKGQWVTHQAFLPKGYLGALSDTPYTFDLDKAKALLAEAGVGPLKVAITVRNNEERLSIAQSIQNTFGQAGIEVELKVGDGAEVLGIYRARQHEITLQTWGPDYPDPNTNSSTFAENADNSDEAKLTGYLAWRNAYDPGELMAMSQAAVVERDTDKRRAMYEELQMKHRETSPFIIMFQQAEQTALRANVKGFYNGGATDSAAYWLVTK